MVLPSACRSRQVNPSVTGGALELFLVHEEYQEHNEGRFGEAAQGLLSCECKCAHDDYRKDFAMVMDKLRDIGDLIEILARQIARLSQNGKQRG